MIRSDSMLKIRGTHEVREMTYVVEDRGKNNNNRLNIYSPLMSFITGVTLDIFLKVPQSLHYFLTTYNFQQPCLQLKKSCIIFQ